LITNKSLILIFILSFIFIFSVSYQDAFASNRKPVLINGKKSLPLRVITRPFANIYKRPDQKSKIVEENVQVFKSFFVYTKPENDYYSVTPKGWYEVGNNKKGKILGWMKADDVMEWKQTMCLSFEHPNNRDPVLMFGDFVALRDLVNSSSDKRIKAVKFLYKTIKSKKIPKDFPIVSIEPEDAVSIQKQFYLLPVLEYKEMEIDEREANLLKIASATKSERGKKYLSEMVNTSEQETAEKLKKLKIDVVYIIDMTKSMQRFLDLTILAVNNISLKLSQSSLAAKDIRFGLWGYRDSIQVPGIEFVTRNYTEVLLHMKEFQEKLRGLKVAKVKTKGYAEDVFTGMYDAMLKTNWNDNTLKVMILIGDAPGRTSDDNWNYSGQSAETIRQFADDNQMYIFAIHIKNHRGADFWETNEEQFRILSQNKGLKHESSYWSVKSENSDAFSKASKTIAQELVYLLNNAKKGIMPKKSSFKTGQKKDEVSQKVRKLGYAALVEWIGKEKNVRAPKDITAWVIDKDLTNPMYQSLNVKLLITKQEIDSLQIVLKEIFEASRRAQYDGIKFFNALQSVSSAASRSGDQIKNAVNLTETGLVPEFIQGLPYKSLIMCMNDDEWDSFSEDQQSAFITKIESRMKYYKTIHDTPDLWIKLDPENSPDEYVFPLPLEMLP